MLLKRNVDSRLSKDRSLDKREFLFYEESLKYLEQQQTVVKNIIIFKKIRKTSVLNSILSSHLIVSHRLQFINQIYSLYAPFSFL